MVKQSETVEAQVIEAIQHIEVLDIPFCAIYIAMSKLNAENRGYRQLEIISKRFEPLLNHAQAKLYLLTNNDFLLFTANPVLEVIDSILYEIRCLFADDFFISSRAIEEFQQIFFLKRDKDSLLKLLQKLQSEEKPIPQIQHSFPVIPTTQELSPDILEKLLYQKNLDIFSLINRYYHYRRLSFLNPFVQD